MVSVVELVILMGVLFILDYYYLMKIILSSITFLVAVLKVLKIMFLILVLIILNAFHLNCFFYFFDQNFSNFVYSVSMAIG